MLYLSLMNLLREDTLLPILTANQKKFGKKLFHTTELSSGFGIADVVFYSLNKKILTKRINNNISPISSFEIINILTKLNSLNTNKISLTFIQDSFPKLKKKREIISYLIEKGFLILDSKKNNIYKLGNNYKIGLQEVVAIEAKLSNWKRGLYQAYRYKEYANKSYLAIHSQYIHRAIKNINDFKRYNVGLVEVKKNDIEIIYEPLREELKENIYSALVYEDLLLRGKYFSPHF